MNLPEYGSLRIDRLSRLFDNMSESYKIFWFQALVDCVLDGSSIITFEELLHNMIADAWYMVSEYRLNLGPSDNLEALVRYFCEASGLPSNASRESILAALQSSNDKALYKFKRTLINNVPYRLQAPFLSMKGKDWSVPGEQLIRRINEEDGLLYRFLTIQGLQSKICIDPVWAAYLMRNQEIIKGWLKYKMIIYLQKRNPGVPGIPNKLSPRQERKLQRVISYWKSVIASTPVLEIYGGYPLSGAGISIDHFVPWSYVTHDELWNLSPTTRSINSKKSNSLPDWNSYFQRLCHVEFSAYEAVWTHESVHREFEKCVKEHSNDEDIHRKLYRPNLSRHEFYANLESIVHPVYIAAQNMGFRQWQL